MLRLAGRLARRQEDRERAPLADLALHLDAAAVHLDEELDHAQAQPQAAAAELEVARRMPGNVEAREERVEDARQAGGLDPGAGVGDGDLRAAARGSPCRQP